MTASSAGAGDKQGKRPDVPPILKFGESDPFYLEQFKALRAKVDLMIDNRNLKIIAITSAIAGEGKTLSSIRLAANLASTSRRKVLLMDLDLRRSMVARELGMAPTPGMSDFFAGSGTLKEIVRNTLVPGLYIVPGGNIVVDPSPLLASEKIRKFFAAIRAEFDVILLDTPPIIPVADTLSLRDQVDGFLFIFRIGVTPYTMLQQALEELGEANALGVVLNGVEPKSYKYYQRYYGNYYQNIQKS